jgi:hypothetical protein
VTKGIPLKSRLLRRRSLPRLLAAGSGVCVHEKVVCFLYIPAGHVHKNPEAQRIGYLFQQKGGSLIMLAKGNRSKQVTDACKKNGGFYLGSIGGPAAILAKDSIKKVEVLDFEELGMEAVRKIYVENFPAFIIVDDKGNDFFQELK